MACDDLTYQINGFDLHDPDEGFELKVGTEYAPALSPRMTVVEIPGVHGALPIWDAPLSPITVTLVVRIYGDSPDQMRLRWNTLVNLLGTGTHQPVQLTRLRGTHVDVADAQLLSTVAPDFEKPRAWVQTALVLNIPTGRWTGDFIEEQLAVPGAAQPSGIGLASSMPVSDLMVRVLGPLSTINITDDVSDTGIAWGGSVVVPGGQYLLIDMSQMKAWIRVDDQWVGSGTDVSATLVHTGEGPLNLVAETGVTGKDSSVTVTASGHSGATELWLRARPATA